jgi:hypothetical protein
MAVYNGKDLKKIDGECLHWTHPILDGNEKRILVKMVINLRASQFTEVYYLTDGLFASPEGVSSWSLPFINQGLALLRYYVDYFSSNLYVTVKHNKFVKSSNACYIFRHSSTIFRH